jgi:hypothetical protein
VDVRAALLVLFAAARAPTPAVGVGVVPGAFSLPRGDAPVSGGTGDQEAADPDLGFPGRFSPKQPVPGAYQRVSGMGT